MGKKETPSDDEVLQAFRACKDLDEEEAGRMAPEIMAVALPLSRSLSLSWPSLPQYVSALFLLMWDLSCCASPLLLLLSGPWCWPW